MEGNGQDKRMGEIHRQTKKTDVAALASAEGPSKPALIPQIGSRFCSAARFRDPDQLPKALLSQREAVHHLLNNADTFLYCTYFLCDESFKNHMSQRHAVSSNPARCSPASCLCRHCGEKGARKIKPIISAVKYLSFSLPDRLSLTFV